MAFFDGVGKKLAQTGQGAAQKAKSMAETVRLSGLISDEERRINGAYTQIGKLYCETSGSSPEPYLSQLVAGVGDSKAKIAAYEEQIKQLKGVVRCPNCGGEVPYGAAFCSSCGSPLNTAATTAPGAGMFCPNCGAPISADKVFCTNCGTKLSQSAAPEPTAPPEPVAETPQAAE